MSQPLLSTTRPAEDDTVDAEDVSASWMAHLSGISPYLALLAAWIATSGSLFFSEVLGWIPCSLCWYQRILMYPLSIILAVGLLRRDRRLYMYVLPLSLVGVCVSLYHYLLQKTDWFPPPACAIGVPCTMDYINWFGFVTIPFLALTAFLIISFMMLTLWLVDSDTTFDDTPDASSRAYFDYDRIAVVGIMSIVIIGFVAMARWI